MLVFEQYLHRLKYLASYYSIYYLFILCPFTLDSLCKHKILLC